MTLRQRGKERRLVTGGGGEPHTPPDPQVLKAPRKGPRFWHQQIHADKPLTAVEFAEQEVDNRYVGRTLQLAFWRRTTCSTLCQSGMRRRGRPIG